MIALGIGVAAVAAFVWLLVIGASITHDPALVERDNQHYQDDQGGAR